MIVVIRLVVSSSPKITADDSLLLKRERYHNPNTISRPAHWRTRSKCLFKQKNKCLPKSKYSKICQAQPHHPGLPGEAIHKLWEKNLSNPDRQQNKKDAHTHVCPAKGEYPSILHFSNVPFSISRPNVKDLFPLFGTDPVLVAISGERDRVKDRLLKPWFGIYV